MRVARLVTFFVIALCFVAAGKAQTTTATPATPTTSATTASQPVDSIQFVSVKTKNDVPIQRGKPIGMEVTVRYTLVSQKSAKLSISVAQFRDLQHCNTGSGELVTAHEIVAHRGSKTVTIPVSWPGDTGKKSNGRVLGHGSLSFMGMFWSVNGPTTARDRYGIYPFYSDYCAQF